MATWVPQSQLPSATARTRQRVAWLKDLQAQVDAATDRYLAEQPEGTQVTLAVLDALGEERVRSLAERSGRRMQTVKQDLGLLVVIRLVDRLGADSVETLRHGPSGRNSTRSRTSDWPRLSWVARYTPQRLRRGEVRAASAEARTEAPAYAAAATASTHAFPTPLARSAEGAPIRPFPAPPAWTLADPAYHGGRLSSLLNVTDAAQDRFADWVGDRGRLPPRPWLSVPGARPLSSYWHHLDLETRPHRLQAEFLSSLLLRVGVEASPAAHAVFWRPPDRRRLLAPSRWRTRELELAGLARALPVARAFGRAIPLLLIGRDARGAHLTAVDLPCPDGSYPLALLELLPGVAGASRLELDTLGELATALAAVEAEDAAPAARAAGSGVETAGGAPARQTSTEPPGAPS